MTFANPSYLWALTGLAIPLAIHLLSRKEGKVIRVGSLRHVEESNTSQFKSIRLNEVFLLLLRMSLVTLLAFFLSGAQCSGPQSGKKIAYVERGINADSLVAQGYELREMAGINYWALAEDLNKLPDDIIVLSFSKAENFKGERIALNENIKWITAEPLSNEFQALAWKVGDSVFVRNATSNETATIYSTRVGLPDSIKVIEPHNVVVSSDNKIVLAALNVLKKQYKLPIEIGDGESIDVVQNIGPLVERISVDKININKPLDQDVALDGNLVIELFKVLYPELQTAEVGKDVRVLPDQFAWSNNVQKAAHPNIPTSQHPNVSASSGIEKYLILLFVLTLAGERFTAIRRNQ
jgi:hypothetical protein